MPPAFVCLGFVRNGKKGTDGSRYKVVSGPGTSLADEELQTTRSHKLSLPKGST